MKKIFIIISMLFSLNTVNGNEVKTTNDIKKEIKKNYELIEESTRLNNIDGLDIKTQNRANLIYKAFCYNIHNAGNIGNKAMSRSLIFQSMTEILEDMRKILDDTQYRKFVKDINLLLYNNGFCDEIRLYCEIR